MRGTRAGEQQRRDRTASRARQNVSSPTGLVTAARRLGNQQMGELALRAAAQRANARPLPATEREELEVEAERASEAVNDGAPREGPAEPPPPPPPPPSGAAAPGGDAGAPLPPDERARFEMQFGERFDDVRIHAGRDAAREAESLGARAFTRGSHVYFGRSGDAQFGGNAALFAHELAHVVQQRHEPSLAAHTFLDDVVVPRGIVDPDRALEVKVDRALSGEALLIELLRQYFNVTDSATARKVIVDEGMDLGEGFVVPEEDVKKGFYVVNITGVQQIQLQLAVKKYGFTPPVRGEVPPKDAAKTKPPTPAPAPEKVTDKPADKPADKPKTQGVSKELADAVERHIELMPDEKQVRPPKQEELEQLKRINAALEKLTLDQRKLFILIAEPTDNLDLYEESVRSFSGIIDGAEEALRKLAAGKVAGVAGAGGGIGGGQGSGVGIGTGTGTGTGLGGGTGGTGGGAKENDPDPRGGIPGPTSQQGDVLLDPSKVTPKDLGGGGGAKDGTALTGTGGSGAKNADDLQTKLDGTWKDVDPKQWGNLDAKGREALAREIAAKQRNIQLKHMVTNPGETLKGMAEGVVRVDKLGKEVAKDIADVADSSKSASARAAAAASAGKKVSMWLSAIIVVVTILAFIVNPALAFKLWMLRAMALMIVGAALAATEAELRIQEAAGAKDFAGFQEAVAKAGSAQAEFIATVALAAVPLVGRLFAKIPFVGKIAGYLGKVTRFGADKLWTLRNAIAKELRDLIKGTEAAMKAEGAGLTKLAAQLEAMSPAEFLEAIRKNKDIREALGFDDAMASSLEQLLKTAEGQKILGQLKNELTKSIADAPDLAQRLTEAYIKNLEEAAAKIENAKTPEEVKAAVDDANRILGEGRAQKDLTARGDEYKDYRLSQAAEEARFEALEREANAQRAADAAVEKAAAEKAAADKAAADKAAPDKAAPDKPADKAAPDKPADKAAPDKPADKPADKAAPDKPTDKAAPDKPADKGLSTRFSGWILG